MAVVDSSQHQNQQISSFRARKRKADSQRAKKKVQFSNELEKVHILPSYEVSLDEPEQVNAMETGEQETSDARRTSQITVLSSEHGRARRELRQIDKHDLQSAVKYGIKSRGHNCPKTGLPRYKYVYGNIVYITDHTSTEEITSYKEPISILPADITNEMSLQHKQDRETLRENPNLCATHSVIVIDQSGSMKKSDVKGFRNRSQAAYGVLALEYIAEQLHHRGESGGIIDVVSLIEMNDNGNVIFDREPLDWILFNKLLIRQKTAIPRSHGSYSNAFKAAEALVMKAIGTLDEVDPEDMTSVAIIFLSDGKPSDKQPEDQINQLESLQSMANVLGSNLSFHAIGLGASDADFEALKILADSVEAFGSQGTFSFSDLNCANLSAAFTSVSTSVTATRTAKLSTSSQENHREKKDVQLRSKSLPTSQRKFRQYVRGVSRWRYDPKAYDKDWPWKHVGFKNGSACAFEMEIEPFGQGAERLAFSFFEVDGQNKRVGKNMVAKETISINDEERKITFHEIFCRVQRKASEIAVQFNKQVEKTSVLRPTNASLKIPRIEFLDCFVYEYKDEDGTTCGVLVEEFLKGKFTKYNSNNGFVKSTKGERTIDLVVGRVYMSDFLQAFSHWVYFSTDQNLLVCDLQGVLNEEGRHPRFQLTDPCICSKMLRGHKRYGKTDIRTKGFRIFRKYHHCNDVCKGLGLPPFGMR